MKTRDYQYINEAIRMSKRSHYRFQLGAVVVNKNQIVGRGFNKVHHSGIRTDGICAEMDALQDTKASLRRNSTVYVCRVNKQGDLLLSRPCHHCETVARKMGVKDIYYSTPEGFVRWTL